MRITSSLSDGIRSATRPCAFAALMIFAISATAFAGEFVGQFDTALVPNREELERVIFKPSPADRWKDAGTFGPDVHFTSAKLIDPRTGEASLLALLVEVDDEDPVIFVDRDGDSRITSAEKFELKEADNPYLWEATVTVAMKGGF